jgi:uncharacterized RDD family membrane protein YckC
MQGEMNAIAHASASLSGSKLDNRRMLAALIDLAVVGAGAALVLVAAGVLGGDGAELGAPLAAVALCWALYYYFACESGGGQTLGKRVMKLRVVRVDGGSAGMGEIAVRTGLRVVDTALVGLIAMLASGERRGRLGDLAAGTMIVSTDPATPAPVPAPGVAAAPDAPVTPLGEAPVARPAVEVISMPDLRSEDDPVVEPEPEVEDEPVVEVEQVVEAEPVVEAEAAVDEPAVELSAVDDPPVGLLVVETPVVDEPEEHAVDVATPSLKELAKDVAAATDTGRPAVAPVAGEETAEAVEPEVNVRSVETVSAIDLIMGEEDDSAQSSPAGDDPAAG